MPATCPPSPNSSRLWWPGCHPQTPPSPPTLTQLLPPQDVPFLTKLPSLPKEHLTFQGSPARTGAEWPKPPERGCAHGQKRPITVANGIPRSGFLSDVTAASLLEGGGQVGTPRDQQAGGARESWGCAWLSCWTGHISTPTHWDQGKMQLKSLIL